MTKKKAEDAPTYVDKKGKRLDGRGITDLREIKIEIGVIPEADGSCYLEWGYNKVMAAVYGPREAMPKHLANPYKAIVNYQYRMAPFSVPDRKNPRPGRRESEISKVSSDALSSAILVERFPNCAIDVYATLFDANAGTRIAALTASSVACVDAGIPMRSMIAACTVGKAGGQVMLDVTKDEEDAPDAVDIPMAILPNTNEIVLLQMDGLLKKDEWQKAVDLGIQGCHKVYEMQKAALKKRFLEDEAKSAKEAKAAGAEK